MNVEQALLRAGTVCGKHHCRESESAIHRAGCMKIVIVTINRCCTGDPVAATFDATAAAAPPSTRSARLELTLLAAICAARLPDVAPRVDRRLAGALAAT